MKNGLPDMGILGFVFTPLLFTVTLLLSVWWNRVKEGRAALPMLDMPALLLMAALRRMPEPRRDWGAAMAMELSQVRGLSSRWRFALGCASVALFPPRKGRLLQSLGNTTMKNIMTTLGSAALISFILVLPFAILEYMSTSKMPPPILFGILWLLPTAFIVILAPIVRTVRAGNSILANPINLLFRVASMSLIAIFWGGVIIDQLPCFLGVPNCD